MPSSNRPVYGAQGSSKRINLEQVSTAQKKGTWNYAGEQLMCIHDPVLRMCATVILQVVIFISVG